jgi:hypothetical protein
MSDFIECSTCGRWFNNTDDSRVCPQGHENAELDYIPAQKVIG